MPPDSSSTIFNLVFASASAKEIPAGPPPMMAMSGSSSVAAGSVRASIKSVKGGVRKSR